MPFIRRTRTATIETTFGTQDFVHEHYVKPTQVQKGDVVIPADELDDLVLADLAVTHPKEFRAAAIARGLVELESDDDEEFPADADDDAGEDDDEIWAPEQEAFMVATAKEAVALVQAAAQAQDIERIAQYADAEAAKDKPRKSVLEALAAAIGE